MIQFWWRSGSRFGSGSPKSEIRILRIGGGLCSLSASSLLFYIGGDRAVDRCYTLCPEKKSHFWLAIISIGVNLFQLILKKNITEKISSHKIPYFSTSPKYFFSTTTLLLLQMFHDSLDFVRDYPDESVPETYKKPSCC